MTSLEIKFLVYRKMGLDNGGCPRASLQSLSAFLLHLEKEEITRD